MFRNYRVTCQVDMCAERIETVNVRTNTDRKAKIKAEDELKKRGHFHVSVIRCEEIQEVPR